LTGKRVGEYVVCLWGGKKAGFTVGGGGPRPRGKKCEHKEQSGLKVGILRGGGGGSRKKSITVKRAWPGRGKVKKRDLGVQVEKRYAVYKMGEEQRKKGAADPLPLQ